MMKKVYVCAPIKGNISANIENAKRYAKYVFKSGMAPVIPLFYALILDDNKLSDRLLAMQAEVSLLFGSDALWVFGNEISDSMKKEIIFAENLNMEVKYISENDLKITEEEYENKTQSY